MLNFVWCGIVLIWYCYGYLLNSVDSFESLIVLVSLLLIGVGDAFVVIWCFWLLGWFGIADFGVMPVWLWLVVCAVFWFALVVCVVFVFCYLASLFVS